MIDDAQATRIREAVDRNFDEQIAMTEELVRFPSVRGAEQTAQDFMAGEMRRRGYAVDRWQFDVEDIQHLPGYSPVKGRYGNAINTVGALRAENPKGRSLIMNGHIDVVPVGPLDMWSRPPFEAYHEGDWLYGRGSGDMKAGLVGAVFALEGLKRAGFRPAADVFVQSVIEEECTGNGALACLARGYRADAALIPEPMGERLLRAQLGVMWFQVHVRGYPVHVAYAGTGSNAIEAAFPLMQALHELEERWNAARGGQEHYKDHNHPINLNVGKIAGGDWASSVPAWCTFDVRVAVFPGQSLKQARQEVEDCIRGAAQKNSFLANSPPEVTFHGFQAEGFVLKNDDAPTAVLRKSHERVFGKALGEVASTGTTDARFFGLYADTPALVYGPSSESVHGFNERVSIESIRQTTQAMALFVAEWCGLEKAH